MKMKFTLCIAAMRGMNGVHIVSLLFLALHFESIDQVNHAENNS